MTASLNKKLGCEYCAQSEFIKEKSVYFSKEWHEMDIIASGKNKNKSFSNKKNKRAFHIKSP